MDVLQEFFQANQGKTITVTVSTGKGQPIQTTSYQAVFDKLLPQEDGSIVLSFHDPSVKSVTPASTIHIPVQATIENAKNTLIIAYTTLKREPVRIILEVIQVSADLPFTDEQPFVRDIKNAAGKTSKIIVSIPQAYMDKRYFEQAATLLHAILIEWGFISLAVRKATDVTWLHRNIQYNQITPVFLPGDTFFQILAYDKKEQITIDLATSMTISVERGIMTYEFDGMSYELIRSDKT